MAVATAVLGRRGRDTSPATSTIGTIGSSRQITHPMPDVVIREMIVDWMSVGKIKGNNAMDWYEERKDKLILDPNTRFAVEIYLRYLQ